LFIFFYVFRILVVFLGEIKFFDVFKVLVNHSKKQLSYALFFI